MPEPREFRFSPLSILLTLFFGRNYTEIPELGTPPSLPRRYFRTAFQGQPQRFPLCCCSAVWFGQGQQLFVAKRLDGAFLEKRSRARLPANNRAGLLAPSLTRESS
jgi:hypothetical protein